MVLQVAITSGANSSAQSNSSHNTSKDRFHNKLAQNKVCTPVVYEITHNYAGFVFPKEQALITRFNKKPKSDDCKKIYNLFYQVTGASNQKEYVLDKLSADPNLSAEDRVLFIEKAYRHPLLLRDTEFLQGLQGVRARVEAKAQIKNLIAAVDAHQGEVPLSIDEQDILQRAKANDEEGVKYKQQLCDMNNRAAQAWEKRARDNLEEGKPYKSYPGYEKDTGCSIPTVVITSETR
jgi:hypothetical protein